MVFLCVSSPPKTGTTGQSTVFQGETAITIDDKGRLAIPTSYRESIARACEGRLVITYNPFEAGSLYLYPHPVWEKVRDQINALPRTKSVSRSLQLKLVGAATFVEPDANGRISRPRQIYNGPVENSYIPIVKRQ